MKYSFSPNRPPPGALLELAAGALEAAAVALAYLLLARVTGSAAGGLLGATIYAITPVWMLAFAWSFHPQIASQLLVLALAALVVLRWPDYRPPLALGWVAALLTLVLLSHISAFLNTVAVAALALPWLLARAAGPRERRGGLRLLAAGAGALAFVGLCFYGAFAPLIAAQLGAVAAGGLAEATARAPAARGALLASLWRDGIVGHYGFFLAPLGLAGAALLALDRRKGGALVPLLWATLAVVLLQALLPLATQSSVTTRYLTYGGWAITVGATIAGRRLWRRGPAARATLAAALAYVAWITAEVWLGAMTLNSWPAEPF